MRNIKLTIEYDGKDIQDGKDLEMTIKPFKEKSKKYCIR